MPPRPRQICVAPQPEREAATPPWPRRSAGAHAAVAAQATTSVRTARPPFASGAQEAPPLRPNHPPPWPRALASGWPLAGLPLPAPRPGRRCRRAQAARTGLDPAAPAAARRVASSAAAVGRELELRVRPVTGARRAADPRPGRRRSGRRPPQEREGRGRVALELSRRGRGAAHCRRDGRGGEGESRESRGGGKNEERRGPGERK
ncbi:hypothetical protein C2845_PM07G34060 [Panicum miliaceum]|uniref:Uncharacterized protein n=1 Tax=Panicum miliaceum TaxID=4540 RepID=A0A3L6SJ70_PANMI|nr:hypothetical protein C2845_PM07G34060 [Panicum miliaceum]